MTDIPKFPLPAGHRYGLSPYDLQVHNGTESVNDQHYLMLWQRQYAKYDRDYTASGQFDGPTQRAAIATQRHCGLTITAEIDPPTWEAVFAGGLAPKPPEIPVPRPPLVVGPKLAAVLDTEADQRARAQQRTRNSFANKILWRNRHLGDVPDWYNLPEADGINKVRSIFGLRPGKRTADLTTRIKGIQRAHKLDVTGDLDPATAWLLDEMVRVS